MLQAKNTINIGDALRDVLTALILKEKRAGLWYGAVESDRTVKSYDFTIHENTAVRLFGVPFKGTVRIGWNNANITEVKGKALTLPDGVLDVDYFIHVRPNKDGEAVALIVPRSLLPAYVGQYARPIFKAKTGTTQFQFNVPAPIPNEGSKKYRDLLAYTVASMTVPNLLKKADTLLGKVNANGREDATANGSNPWLNERKNGLPYGER